MCGICGWVDWNGAADEAVVRRMADRISARGPDGEGMWRDPSGIAVLGHRRLKVLDLSDRAEQPMQDPGGDVLVYNGEVYTFVELRRALEDAGRPVASSGDAEVVLASLVRWGPEVLHRFNGMFALALWSPLRRRLLLARDRIGIKPLFVASLAHGLIFASELPALLSHPEVAADLDPDAIARWLQLGYPAERTSLLRGVWRLPPGHLLEAEDGRVVVRPWYELADRVAIREDVGLAEAAEELEPLLRDAVRIRLVSDVPLGCFLSGGVDSTAVVAAAAAEGAHPETLTVRFPDGTDESRWAGRTATALGLDNRVERCSSAEMLEVFNAWPRIAGDPLADPSLAPTWVVSRAARQRWTVALSGDGGDELLSGYPRLRFMPRLRTALRLPSSLRRGVGPLMPARRWGAKLGSALAADDEWSAYQALQGVWPADHAARLCGLREVALPWSPDLLERLTGLPVWHRYRMLDALTFLPERVLAKVDRASMDHSLEVRVPLLDHRVVELLLSLPPRLGSGKSVLRRVVHRLGAPQPPRAKRGFEVPLAGWLRGPLRERVRADLFGSTADGLGLHRQTLQRVWGDHQAGRADHGERLLAVAVLVRWVEQWL
jgi:asparagine synthase (glutamine-hydrolysing)